MRSTRLEHLDFLRGAAALLVLAGHLRSYLFQNYAELGHANLLLGGFYLVTGLGHQAVMIFFALSGFLVGGRALSDNLNHRFSWARYLLRRLTRLWIVIIPALVLTLLFDSLGIRLTDGVGYDGRFCTIYSSGPCSTAGLEQSLTTFIGNLFFLQTIWVVPFGSNAPMWSLASEFWYYVVFPLALWLVCARIGLVTRVAGALALIAVLRLLPDWLLAYGLIWVAGAAAAWCHRRQFLAGFMRHLLVRGGALCLLVGAIVLAKLRLGELADLGLGLVVASVLPVLASLPNPGSKYGAVARASSEISYTLYLTHFPLLTFIILTGLAPHRMQMSPAVAAVYGALLLVCIGWAAALWWCFERNTDRVYAALSRNLPPKPLQTPSFGNPDSA
ncbi:MAG: acyltransferase [Alphaproteobacteria bacterium]|nr:acyltransferase [Alphaproteobacteria bacterium]